MSNAFEDLFEEVVEEVVEETTEEVSGEVAEETTDEEVGPEEPSAEQNVTQEVVKKKRGRKPGSKNSNKAVLGTTASTPKSHLRNEIVSEIHISEDVVKYLLKKWKGRAEASSVSDEIQNIQESIVGKNPSEVDAERLLKQMQKLQSKISGGGDKQTLEVALSTILGEQLPGFSFSFNYNYEDGKISGVRVVYTKTIKYGPPLE